MKPVAPLLAFLALAAPSSAQEAANPEYLRWSRFPAGTVVVREIADQALGLVAVASERLAAVSEKEAQVETTMVVTVRDRRYERPAVTRTIPALISAGEGLAAPAETGTETLGVAGEPQVCTWAKTTGVLLGKETTTRVWVSDRVPGGVVKVEVETGGDPPAVTRIRLLSVERPE